MLQNFCFKKFGTLLFLVMLMSLAGCGVTENQGNKSSDQPVIRDNDGSKQMRNGNHQFLTKSVYNATISSLEEEAVLVEESDFESDIKDDNVFTFDKIQVLEGYRFKAVLDFDFVPYFIENYEGQEIDVVISILIYTVQNMMLGMVKR